MLDDLHAIRVRANLIERNVSGLRPADDDVRAFDLWSETMALTGEQFHGVMVALRAAADAELGCGPLAAERELADEQAAENLAHSVAVEPELVSIPSADPPPTGFVVSELESSSSWKGVAIMLSIVLGAALCGLAVLIVAASS